MRNKQRLLILLILVGWAGWSVTSRHARAQSPSTTAQTSPVSIEAQAGTWKT